ncbi:uncharacterized protein [Haliotis asinina]|uniref:uncharacterized protein n=1 Tax=Haliotis asinina TaxID=109174 RepID=UPI003531C4E5
MGDVNGNEPATINHTEVHVDVRSSGATYSTNGDAVTQQGGVPIIAQNPDPDRKPKDFVMTNCFVVFACNFIFGFIGYHYGVKSNWAWKLGQEHEARKKAKIALIFAILGIVAGTITYCLAFGLYFTVGKKPIDVTHKGTPP